MLPHRLHLRSFTLLITLVMVLFSGLRKCEVSGTVKTRTAVIQSSTQQDHPASGPGEEARHCNVNFWLTAPVTMMPTQQDPAPAEIFEAHPFHPQQFFNAPFQPPRQPLA